MGRFRPPADGAGREEIPARADGEGSGEAEGGGAEDKGRGERWVKRDDFGGMMGGKYGGVGTAERKREGEGGLEGG